MPFGGMSDGSPPTHAHVAMFAQSPPVGVPFGSANDGYAYYGSSPPPFAYYTASPPLSLSPPSLQMLHMAMGGSSPPPPGYGHPAMGYGHPVHPHGMHPHHHQHPAGGPILFAPYGGGTAYGVHMNVSPPPTYGAPYAGGELSGEQAHDHFGQEYWEAHDTNSSLQMAHYAAAAAAADAQAAYAYAAQQGALQGAYSPPQYYAPQHAPNSAPPMRLSVNMGGGGGGGSGGGGGGGGGGNSYGSEAFWVMGGGTVGGAHHNPNSGKSSPKSLRSGQSGGGRRNSSGKRSPREGVTPHAPPLGVGATGASPGKVDVVASGGTDSSGGASGSEAAAADGARSADGDLNFDDLFSRSPPPPGTTPGAKG